MKINKIFCNKKNKQVGLSMVEIGLVFTVIAVAVAGVMYAYNSVRNEYYKSQIVKATVNEVAAEQAYLSENSGKEKAVQNDVLVKLQYYKSVASSLWLHDKVYFDIVAGAYLGIGSYDENKPNAFRFVIYPQKGKEGCAWLFAYLSKNLKGYGAIDGARCNSDYPSLCIQYGDSAPITGVCLPGLH